MTVVHTYFYIVVDTQWGCRTLKLYISTLSHNGHDFGGKNCLT